GAPMNIFDAAPGRVVGGILGGEGHYNNSTLSANEQIRNVKNLNSIIGNQGQVRYFDSLIAVDALGEYPQNPFISAGPGQHAQMRNVFRFALEIGAGFNPNANFSSGVSDEGAAGYSVALYVTPSGSGGVTLGDPMDSTRLFLRQSPLPGGMPVNNITFTPQGFSNACLFGTGEGDYFAAGDFAYVPVLSTSAYPFGDSAITLENETFKWGVSVTGYFLFGYGHQSHKNREFEDEQREFVNVGLPGYGGPGVDTIYENYVLQCFEGAIYFSKNI
ncbi:hypothetical protein IIA79_07685, partial [bacterium]|nr:hypothetical protein [bacterium]